MFFVQFITLFLLTLFFSWSLFLLASPKKKKPVSPESSILILMIILEIILVLILVLASLGEAVLGLVMGVNLIGFLLTPGLVPLLHGSTKVKVKNLRLDFLAVFLISALPLIFLKDFQVSRGEGLFLLLIGVFFFSWRWHLSRLLYKRIVIKKKRKLSWRLVLGFLLATIFFLLSLLMIFSLELTPSLFILGLLPLALLVSLPEILINLELIKNKPLVFLDGLLLPLVFNTTFILGLAAFLSPLRITNLFVYLKTALLFLIGFVIFYFFAWSKRRIDRLEGLILTLYFFLALIVILI